MTTPRKPVDAPLPEEGDAVEKMAQASKRQVRRRFAFRSSAWLVLLAVAGFLIVVHYRNTRLINDYESELKPAARQLTEHVQRYGYLPSSMPEGIALPMEYRDSEVERRYILQSDAPMILAFSPEFELVFRGRYRAVLICHDAQVTTTCLSADDFDERKAREEALINAYIEEQKKRPPTSWH